MPAWVASRLASLRSETDPPVLPGPLIPSEPERAAIAAHVVALRELMRPCPANDVGSREATLVTVTKLLLALPGPRASEAAAEARGEAYMAALEDVPSWAVAEAVRRWHCGACGEAHDYRWAPAPAVLRRIAELAAWRVAGRIASLERLLRAVPARAASREDEVRIAQGLRALADRLAGGAAAPRDGREPAGMARLSGHATRVIADLARRAAERNS